MFADLHGFFGFSLSPQTEYLFDKNFEDGIVANKNARILYENTEVDGVKKIALMYVFANDRHIIITKSPEVVSELSARLSGSRIKK